MKSYESKLKAYIKAHEIDAEHLSFEQSCHSVEEAAKAANAEKEDFVKNICMISSNGQLIIAIVKGEDRASTDRVAKALNIERPRIATPEEILHLTGYPCGGTPSFGYIQKTKSSDVPENSKFSEHNAVFLIDQRVMEKDFVYSGGGSQNSLVRISTKELQKANNGKICRVRK